MTLIRWSIRVLVLFLILIKFWNLGKKVEENNYDDDFDKSEDENYDKYDDYYNVIENNPQANKKDLIKEMINRAKLYKEEKQKIKSGNQFYI